VGGVNLSIDTKSGGHGKLSAPSATSRPSSRWIWIAFFLLVVGPLYFIAAVVCIRSGLFQFNGAALGNAQLKAVLTFLAAALAATAAVLGSILTMSHSDRTLAFQAGVEAETNERLNLDTVIRCLNLICNDGNYAPKAATAAGFATLVQLGHPIIAMRALASAFPEHAVDRSTATWLIGEVLTSKVTKGTPTDLVAARKKPQLYYGHTFLNLLSQMCTETSPGQSR